MAAPLSPSGLPTVDAQWGGLAAGGAYLLVGRAAAGRTALALQSAGATVSGGGRALLISPRAPDALVKAGASVSFDLRAAHATGRFRVVRIPSAADLAARGSDGLDKAYADLTALILADRPDRVVVEDLTPLVQFDTFERFRAALSGLVAALRGAGTTLLLGLGEPANDASEQLLAVVRPLVDATATIETDGASRRLVLARHDEEPAAAPVAPPTAPPLAAAPPAAAPVAAPPAAPPAPVEAPGQSSDGASVETGLPTPSAESPASSDGLPRTQIVPPPEADPSLFEPAPDPFGQDPAASMFEQGYLVDSGANGVVGVIQPPAQAPSTPAPASAAPPVPAAPAFASLASAPADPADEVRHALDAAFAARAQGTPFLAVAARMDPAVPESAHFFAVADGLRRALRPEDRLLVDLPRRRAVVVLPGVGAEGATALFARLQGHLRATLGEEAEDVLRAIAAVSVPDGQPFTSTQDLLAYAYES